MCVLSFFFFLEWDSIHSENKMSIFDTIITLLIIFLKADSLAKQV